MQPSSKYWSNGVSLFDAGTGNGIRLWKPPGDSVEAFVQMKFATSYYWHEVSVLGYIYPYDCTRHLKEREVNLEKKLICLYSLQICSYSPFF